MRYRIETQHPGEEYPRFRWYREEDDARRFFADLKAGIAATLVDLRTGTVIEVRK